MLVRFIFDELYVSEPFKNTVPGFSILVHFSKLILSLPDLQKFKPF